MGWVSAFPEKNGGGGQISRKKALRKTRMAPKKQVKMSQILLKSKFNLYYQFDSWSPDRAVTLI